MRPILRRMIRRSIALFAPALFVLSLVATSITPAVASDIPKASDALLQQAQANPNGTFRVIITRAGSGRDADAYLAAAGHPKLKDVADFGLVANIRGKEIAALATLSAVKRISLDAQMVSTDDGCASPLGSCNLGTVYPQSVHATSEWTNAITGKGIGVAVIDSGVNGSLPDLTNGANGSSRVVAQVNYSSTSSTLSDLYGHGTHVAGIIAGNSWYGGPATAGKYMGIAPQANIVSVRVSNATGMAYVSDVINGIDWAIQNRQTYNIRVMNISLISSRAESYLTSALDAEVEKAWFNGILVVVSAGNGGANSSFYPPANDPFAVTVGAVDTKGTIGTADDTLAPWSSYGLTEDGYAKPDVVAPGRYMTSLMASPGETLAQQFPTNVVDGSYITLSGTSMAAPVVSGAAALVFQAHPNWTNDQVKALLGQTARLLGTTLNDVFTPYVGQGAGEINAAAAANYSAIPTYANQGQIISPLLIGPSGQTVYTNALVLSGSSSWSTSSWSTSSWSTIAALTSSWSTSSWSTTSPTLWSLGTG